MSYHFERNRHYSPSLLKYIASGVFVVIIAIIFFIIGSRLLRISSAAKSTTSDILATAVIMATPKSVLLARQQALQTQNNELNQQLLGMQLLEDENEIGRASCRERV